MELLIYHHTRHHRSFEHSRKATRKEPLLNEGF